MKYFMKYVLLCFFSINAMKNKDIPDVSCSLNQQHLEIGVPKFCTYESNVDRLKIRGIEEPAVDIAKHLARYHLLFQPTKRTLDKLALCDEVLIHSFPQKCADYPRSFSLSLPDAYILDNGELYKNTISYFSAKTPLFWVSAWRALRLSRNKIELVRFSKRSKTYTTQPLQEINKQCSNIIGIMQDLAHKEHFYVIDERLFPYRYQLFTSNFISTPLKKKFHKETVKSLEAAILVPDGQDYLHQIISSKLIDIIDYKAEEYFGLRLNTEPKTGFIQPLFTEQIISMQVGDFFFSRDERSERKLCLSIDEGVNRLTMLLALERLANKCTLLASPRKLQKRVRYLRKNFLYLWLARLLHREGYLA